MDDKQLKRIEQELIRQMDKELQREEMVEELAKEVAAKLIASGKAEVELEDKAYRFQYKVFEYGNKRIVNMVVADIRKFQILQERYIPYKVSAELDNNLSLQENLASVAEAFFRHVLGMVKAEELDD